MRFVRWDNWVLWMAVTAVGLIFLVVIIAAAASAGDGEPVRSKSEKSSGPPLFADASDGIEQFIGGSTMPEGSYDFDCSFSGNVSVQLGSPPYTVSLKQGDQTRWVSSGDMVTVGFCKVHGPK